ncbi:DASH complex subunit DAM1 [Spathaspora sp. JA1]|nr:DASH complex subunit DAM1 [Spathaspora sp. JA1]
MSSSNPVTPQAQINRRRSNRSSSGAPLSTSSPALIPIDANNLPFESPAMLAKFARLADSIEELDCHEDQMEKIHKYIANDFNEGLSGLLHGLSISMWCVGFQGGPTTTSINKFQQRKQRDIRIKQLEDRLKNSQRLNSSLKSKLQELKPKQPVSKPPPAPRNISNTSRVRPKQTTRTQITRTRPETVSWNESSIHEPPKRAPQETTTGRPNLNQPPRYLQGLFEQTNTGRQQNRAKTDVRKQQKTRFR